jgi:hypothetical protein
METETVIDIRRAGARGRRTAVKGNKSYARSKISNDQSNGLLPNVDGRSLVARRFKDIAQAVLSDQAGPDNCSAARLQLIRRFAAAAVMAEQLEAKLANGEEIDISAHAQLLSTLVRLAQRIGLSRRMKDISPQLIDILQNHEPVTSDSDE